MSPDGGALSPRSSFSGAVSHPDGSDVTKRIGFILATGLVALLATGGYAMSSRGSGNTLKPLPHWGLYTDADWTKLQTALAVDHFVPASLEIVTGTSLERNHQPFAILRARTTTGRPCFAVVAGMAVERVICRLTVPLMTFTKIDSCAACAPGKDKPLQTLTLLALVRRDVQAVTSTSNGRVVNVGVVPVGDGESAFNVSGFRKGTTLKALASTNAILSEIRLRTEQKSH
jgi:hypothetical protein